MSGWNKFLFLIMLLAMSCQHQFEMIHIYNDKEFSEVDSIAKERNLPYCIVLIDTLEYDKNEYINNLKDIVDPSNRFILNFICVNSNDKTDWMVKLLTPQIYPTACIFESSGQLIDLIPGNSKESFSYLCETLKTEKTNIEYHYNQLYEDDKEHFIKYINEIIELQSHLVEGQNVISGIDSLFQEKNHPLLLFMRLQNLLEYGNDVEIKNTAKNLLTFDSPQELVYYQDELLFANYLLDSTYTSETAPRIYSLPEIQLTNCEINNPYILNIEISNNGKKTLKISDIMTSCTCVNLIGDKRLVIDSNESETLKVKFTPDVQGKVYRYIYIASNSLNSPIYTISIKANVNK